MLIKLNYKAKKTDAKDFLEKITRNKYKVELLTPEKEFIKYCIPFMLVSTTTGIKVRGDILFSEANTEDGVVTAFNPSHLYLGFKMLGNGLEGYSEFLSYAFVYRKLAIAGLSNLGNKDIVTGLVKELNSLHHYLNHVELTSKEVNANSTSNTALVSFMVDTYVKRTQYTKEALESLFKVIQYLRKLSSSIMDIDKKKLDAWENMYKLYSMYIEEEVYPSIDLGFLKLEFTSTLYDVFKFDWGNKHCIYKVSKKTNSSRTFLEGSYYYKGYDNMNLSDGNYIYGNSGNFKSSRDLQILDYSVVFRQKFFMVKTSMLYDRMKLFGLLDMYFEEEKYPNLVQFLNLGRKVKFINNTLGSMQEKCIDNSLVLKSNFTYGDAIKVLKNIDIGIIFDFTPRESRIFSSYVLKNSNENIKTCTEFLGFNVFLLHYVNSMLIDMHKLLISGKVVKDLFTLSVVHEDPFLKDFVKDIEATIKSKSFFGEEDLYKPV